MKAWSDEWKCARLRLYLRSEQLFQGETVNVHVCANVAPPSRTLKSAQNGQEAATSMLQRWREHCEGAHVQIQVVQLAQVDPHASISTPPSTTLFRQDTHISHVSVAPSENGIESVVTLTAQFDLKVRHEFWNREILLIVHVSPKSGFVAADGDLRPDVRRNIGASLLQDEWRSSQLLSLTREETQPTPMMERRVEQRIVVIKPLQLDMETRELAGQRMGILARASNTHSSLTLAIRDLHLHLDQSLRTSSRDSNRFRIVSGDKVPFPVVLLPQERYNFLFVLEPVEVVVVTDESLEGVQHKPATTMKPNSPRKGKSPLASTAQRTLLTLSWQAVSVSMNAITENRTIVWAPKTPSRQFAPTSDEERELIQNLVAYVLTNRGAKLYTDFKCVRLLPTSALHTTISPLSTSIAVGSAVTVCVTVANRSARTNFDLTMVLPAQNDGVVNRSTATATGAVGFEASHRLGLIGPGMSVRRSLHVAFLRLGKCKLGPLVLVDHLTRTCFLSDDWEVFIRK